MCGICGARFGRLLGGFGVLGVLGVGVGVCCFASMRRCFNWYDKLLHCDHSLNTKIVCGPPRMQSKCVKNCVGARNMPKVYARDYNSGLVSERQE